MFEEIYPRLLEEVLTNTPRTLPDQIESNRPGNFHTPSETNKWYGELIKSVYESDPESDIGLQLGQYLLPSKLCDFSRVLITADSGKDVLGLIQKLFYLQGSCYHPFVHFDRDRVSISLVYPYKPVTSPGKRRFCAETAFSYLINGIRETLAPDFVPLKLCCDFAEPKYSKDYESLFGPNIEFNQNLSMIEFDANVLNLKLATRNKTLHQIYLHKFLDFIRSFERERNFEHKAITFMLLHHPDVFNSQALAKKMNISVRGLQKRLNKTGQSFSSVTNTCRKELAKVYLIQKRQNVDFTAEQLGFQSSSGFHRFFKSEFNSTPIQYCGEVRLEQST